MSSRPPWQRPARDDEPQQPAPPQQQPAPPPAQAPQQSPPPPQAPPPAPAPPQAPGQTPPPGQAPPPPGYSPPPGGGGSKKGLLIGGIVAAVVLLGGIGACAGLVAAGSDPQPVRSGGGGGRGGGGGGGRGDSPSEGSLKDLVQEDVGPFTLENVAENPKPVEAGATEAYKVKYSSSSNGDVLHLLSAYSSEDEPAAIQTALPAEYKKEGFTEAGQQDLTNESGEQVGSLTAMVNESEGTEIIIWNNGKVLAQAIGGTGNAQAFYKEIPY